MPNDVDDALGDQGLGSDRDVQAIEESILARAATLVYTVMVDENGYLPTHDRPPTRGRRPLSEQLLPGLLTDGDDRGIEPLHGLEPYFGKTEVSSPYSLIVEVTTGA